MFPTADQIATAIVEACRAFGEDPEAVWRGEPGLRGRIVAMAALCEGFPDANRRQLAIRCGYSVPRAAQSGVLSARKCKWWSELLVDEIVGALVAEQYGDQAA